MSSWIQIRVVSDDEESEPRRTRGSEQRTSSAGFGKWLAIGGGLVLLGVVLFAGWYFGFRGGHQPAKAAVKRPTAGPAASPQTPAAPTRRLGRPGIRRR
ncbi:MAG: hypothetical protein MAG451_01946 [Anaerolineales bacterium]|nr:hypothetical protein [Anaerolineales bacterium]